MSDVAPRLCWRYVSVSKDCVGRTLGSEIDRPYGAALSARTLLAEIASVSSSSMMRSTL